MNDVYIKNLTHSMKEPQYSIVHGLIMRSGHDSYSRYHNQQLVALHPGYHDHSLLLISPYQLMTHYPGEIDSRFLERIELLCIFQYLY